MQPKLGDINVILTAIVFLVIGKKVYTRIKLILIIRLTYVKISLGQNSYVYLKIVNEKI